VAAAGLLLLGFAWRCDARWAEAHVFLPQQFFLVASSAVAVGVRVAAGSAGALLLLLVPFLPRGAAGRRLLVAVLLALLASEGLLRWRVRPLVRQELTPVMRTLTAPHPRYGNTFSAGLDRLLPLSGREIRIRTDGEGRRISGASIDPSLPSLVFTGESTMAGIGLQWEETFAALVADRLELQAVNLGSPFYRADQSWLRLKDELPALEHPRAIIGVFMPGLIARSFAGQLHPPAQPSPSLGVELVPPGPPGALQSSGFYLLWRHLYWSDAAIAEGMRSVGAAMSDMAALARARGAPCVFLVTGHTPPWMVRELFERRGLDHVVVEVPREELLDDGHPGPRGSIRIADALEKRLRMTLANR
jgi:hypothetical protein